MQSIIPPPIKTAISEFKSGIVNIIWNQFFLGLYKLFSQPNYGSKPCTFTISGITGSYTTDYKWISDRDFVHFNISITPTTSMVLSGASILPVLTNSSNFSDVPLNISNISISLVDGTTIMDSRILTIDTTGNINLPDILSTTYSLVISGSFIKDF